jgi:hypothetical protein
MSETSNRARLPPRGICYDSNASTAKQGEQILWQLIKNENRPALVLIETDEISRRQRFHDLKGAIRTLELAQNLGAFNHLGRERAEALAKAIEILTGEAKILVEAYGTGC